MYMDLFHIEFPGVQGLPETLSWTILVIHRSLIMNPRAKYKPDLDCEHVGPWSGNVHLASATWLVLLLHRGCGGGSPGPQ